MILALLLLAPCAIAGVALLSAGLCRSRNAAHALVGALCAAGSAILAWVATGYALFGGAGCRVFLAGRWWNFAGDGPLLMRGVVPDERALFVLVAAALAAVIPLSSGAERWRLGSMCAFSAVFGGVLFPLVAHGSWNGWLRDLGLVDVGGSGTIHATGGLTGLAVAWTLGARRGKYTRDGLPVAMPGHSAVLALTGCFLAWVGWLGIDGAGAALAGGSAVAAAMNTTVSAAASAMAAAGLTRWRFGKTDASLTANGWMAGLVAAAAGCASMTPGGALFTGAVAGAITVFAIEWTEARLFVDDPGGAVSSHGLCGLWGLGAAALFGGAPGLAQFTAAATLVGAVLPAAYGIAMLLGRRVSAEGERRGLDLDELGGGAYPDFATHRDD